MKSPPSLPTVSSERRAGRPRALVCAPVLLLAGFIAMDAGRSAAQETYPPGEPVRVPAVTGGVSLGLTGGTVRGRVCLNDLPAEERIVVVLNQALRIHSVEGGVELRHGVELEPGGATIRHPILRSRSGADRDFGPLCLEYGGTETVHDVASGEYREDDSSMLIAFDGRSVRARGSARWYPALFDPVAGHVAEASTYRIEVECAECRWIYMNGGAVEPGPAATFQSNEARELYLLAGDLPLTRTTRGLIVGEAVAADTAALFFDHVWEIRSILEDYLRKPYAGDPVVVRTAGVREPLQGRLWAFYSDPALTLTGMTIPEFVETLTGSDARARRSVLGFLAHELAHHYFGWQLGTRSPQRDLFGEPFATFLEVEVVRRLFGPEEYGRARRSFALRGARDSTVTPIDEAGPADLSEDSYRYGYVPAVLFALQDAIGEGRMRETLRALLDIPPAERPTADYTALKRAALSAGVTEAEWTAWEGRCVRSAGPASCFTATSTE